MGKWIKDFYLVEKDEFSQEILAKIDDFAQKVTSETYDRFSYDYERRMETIRIGKLSEEVFAKFMFDEYNIRLEINYDIYEGIDNVDEDDFEVNGFKIDIKSSKDTKKAGFEKCFSSFNFPVPADQEVKDVTYSIIYSFDLRYYIICAAIFKNDYLSKQHFGKLDVGGGVYRTFRLCKLTNGSKVKRVTDWIVAHKKEN
ncbi:MAG: hypothetical protein IJQ67_05610 [Bacilli bacterium]|nr:hypothetical protein [Bacilli bacterium]